MTSDKQSNARPTPVESKSNLSCNRRTLNRRLDGICDGDDGGDGCCSFRCTWRCPTVEATATDCACATGWKCSATPATISVLPAPRRLRPHTAAASGHWPPSATAPTTAGCRPTSGRLSGDWLPPSSCAAASSTGTRSASWRPFCRFPPRY